LQLHVPLNQVTIKSMQHVLIALQCEEVSSYSILVNGIIYFFSLDVYALVARGRRPVCLLCTPLVLRSMHHQ